MVMTFLWRGFVVMMNITKNKAKKKKYNRIKIQPQAVLHRRQYFQRFFNFAKMDKLEVYGKPSEELQKVITSSDAQTYDHFV